ncbi:hypothetical protein [uncultured Ferrovibrio sp.]|jgi:hypothetical protein|uniref:hypothetical protein n=1 Tax=uncultured Ferrovibrio sp. TaxID=1576913 RepID=UPI00262EFE43|nr:hypothetical protein [uncultured Ferrovibrio sp.]
MPKITKIVEVANDDDEMDAMSDEARGDDLEGLRAVARLSKLCGRISWFSAVGEPLEPSEIADAEAYVSALGFPDVSVAAVEDWRAAAAAAQAPDWSQDWWQAEEQMRKALLEEALSLNPEHDLMVALTHVSTKASEVSHGLAAVSAARAGVADEALIRVAAGAAAQAAYQAALVLAADGDAEHPFAVKFRLFEAGRLPLGIVGNTFNLF